MATARPRIVGSPATRVAGTGERSRMSQPIRASRGAAGSQQQLTARILQQVQLQLVRTLNPAGAAVAPAPRPWRPPEEVREFKGGAAPLVCGLLVPERIDAFGLLRDLCMQHGLTLASPAMLPRAESLAQSLVRIVAAAEGSPPVVAIDAGSIEPQHVAPIMAGAREIASATPLVVVRALEGTAIPRPHVLSMRIDSQDELRLFAGMRDAARRGLSARTPEYWPASRQVAQRA